MFLVAANFKNIFCPVPPKQEKPGFGGGGRGGGNMLDHTTLLFIFPGPKL